MKITFTKKICFAAAAAFFFSPVFAQNWNGESNDACYGAEVLNYEQGLQTNGESVADDRSNPEVSLGAPSSDNSAGSFFSLGVGGFIEIGFPGIVLDLPGNDIKVVETSFSGNDCGFNDDEFADIELSSDGINWELYGTICRNEEIDIANTGLEFVTAIRITNSEITTTLDGYDVDGVLALNGCEDFDFFDPTDCYGHEALVYTPGAGNIPANRMNPEQATGAPERDNSVNFVALGFGGTLVLGFEESAIAVEGEDDLEVVETTFGNQSCQSYEERAQVYVSQQVVTDAAEIDDSQFVYVGESCTNGAFFDVYAETGFEYFTLVKITDVTPEAAQLSNRDGYDVDGIVALHGCQPTPDPSENTDPFCTNETVIQQHSVTGGNVRLTSMGYHLECDGMFGYRWRIRNESGEPRVVFYNFAGAPELQGPFNLEGDEEVHFTTGFGQQAQGGGTMRIFVDGEQVNVKAHGGSTKDLAECGEGCPETVIPTPQGQLGATLETYPNPSPGPVNVEFVSERSQRITVQVTDMSGRVVATLFNADASAEQTYRTTFNGASLPNGIYITRMTTETDIVVKKVMIAR